MKSQTLHSQVYSRSLTFLVAAMAATITIAIFMEGIARIILGWPLKPAAMICQLMGWDNSMLWAGEVIHYTLTLLIIPLSFVLIRAIFKLGPSALVGAVWGLIIWFQLATVIAPKAGMPVFFGGGKLMFISMISHVSYGAVLGFVFGRMHPGSFFKGKHEAEVHPL